MSAIHGLAFGDPAEDLWGVAWAPEGLRAVELALHSGPVARTIPVELSTGAQDDPWRIEGEGVSLMMKPSGAAGHGQTAEAPLRSSEQLCAVGGHLELDAGGRREVGCLGWRTTVENGLELERIGSFRQTVAWFEPAHGLSLLALRPAKARGQEADLVSAAVLEPDPTPPVSDPRLSTTYDASGRPERAGLELWLGPPAPPEESEEQAPPHLPRRAAGRAHGPGIAWKVEDFRLYATLLRWHSRGSVGSGIYLLGDRG